MQTNFSSCQKADLGIQQDPDPASLQHTAAQLSLQSKICCVSVWIFSLLTAEKNVLGYFWTGISDFNGRAEHWAAETPLWISRHISSTDAL